MSDSQSAFEQQIIWSPWYLLRCVALRCIWIWNVGFGSTGCDEYVGLFDKMSACQYEGDQCTFSFDSLEAMAMWKF